MRIGSAVLVMFLLSACAKGAQAPYSEDALTYDGGMSVSGGMTGSGGMSVSGGTTGSGGMGISGMDGTGGTTTGGMSGGGTGGGGTPGTCTDTKKNQTETGTDCGGPCPACANASGCLVAADCMSKYCSPTFVCADAPAPGCTDKLQNGAETDIDCGGGSCGGCLNGKKCKIGTDCMSTVCTSTKCACKAKTMAEACGTMTCGATVADGCGGTVNCGTCGTGTKCSAGMCVPNACVVGSCPACIPFVQGVCCKANDTCGCNLLGAGACM